MSSFGGPNIITDGLVLNLDAGNTKSYPGTGTTWTDRSGFGNNGTLINGPTFNAGNGGSIVLDGVDDFGDFGNNQSLNITGDLSVSVWIRTTGLGGNRIMVAKQVLPSNAANYEGYLKGNSVYWWDGQGERNTGISVLSNQWSNIIYTRISTTVTAYINYNLVGSVTVFPQGPVTANLTVGKDQNNQNFSGNIASVQIYNRALSASEVLQNYNATKGRFGIV